SALYFAAGINDEQDGLFGSIRALAAPEALPTPPAPTPGKKGPGKGGRGDHPGEGRGRGKDSGDAFASPAAAPNGRARGSNDLVASVGALLSGGATPAGSGTGRTSAGGTDRTSGAVGRLDPAPVDRVFALTGQGGENGSSHGGPDKLNLLDGGLGDLFWRL